MGRSHIVALVLAIAGAMLPGGGRAAQAVPATPDAAACLMLPSPPPGCVDALVQAAQAQLTGDPRIDEAYRYAIGERYARKLLQLSMASFGEIHEHTATAYNFVAIFVQKRDPAEAEAAYARAIEIARQAPDNRIRLTIYLRNFGIFLGGLSRLADAEAVLREALAVATVARDVDQQLKARLELGWLLTRMGRTDDAHEILLAGVALAEDKRVLSDVSASIYLALGDNFQSQSRYSDALAYYRQALAMTVKVSGENSRAAADVYVVLGEIAARQGNSAEVRRMQRRVYRIRLKTLGPRHPTIAASRFNMAMTKWRTRGGNPLPELRVALKDIESAYGADSEEALNYALALTHPLHSQGAHVEELAIEAKAVGALEKRLARTDPSMISKWIELALSLRNHERPIEALVYFRRGNGALIERIRDSSRSPALLDEYGRKRGYFRWQVAAEWAVANPE